MRFLPLLLAQPRPQEDPDAADRRLVHRGLLPVRPARRHRVRLPPGHRRRRRRPAGRHRADVHYPAAAACVPRAAPRLPGVEARPMPRGSAASTRTRRTSSRNSRSCPRTGGRCTRSSPSTRRSGGVPGGPPGRAWWARSSRRASAGRSVITCRSRRPVSGWRRLGLQRPRHLPRHAAQRRRDAVLAQARLPLREGPALLARHRRLVHRSVSRPRRRGCDCADDRRGVRQLRLETRTQTESAFAAAFVRQMGNIEFLIARSARSCSSRCCWSPATRWRSPCANGPTSSRCSRPSATRIAPSSRSSSPSRC